MVHATDAKNVAGIRRRGLLVRKSRASVPSVWLCSPSLAGRAVTHAMRRHGLPFARVAVVEVDVPRSWLRAGRGRGVKHTGGRDVPPGRVVAVHLVVAGGKS
jgi:hypothetical protein